MKLSTKIFLPLILISALLILLTGCFGVPSDESPGYTPGTITGTIAAPCCENSDGLANGETASPEYWCYYCEKDWKLQQGIEVVLTYGEDEVATTTTNDQGEFTFTNVDPGKNYVVTAYCPDFDDNRPLVKDVALELIEGGSFDTKITDIVSTSLGLVVDFLVDYADFSPEDIILEGVIVDKPDFPNFPKFKKLIPEVVRVLEACQNVDTDDDLQDALCRAAEEVGRETIPTLVLGCGPGFTPPPPPPPGPCAGNVAPSISSVLLDGTPVLVGDTIHVLVGTPYVVTVNASDDGIANPLTYSATIDGNPVGSVVSNVITVTPSVAGTFEVFVNVNDGCTITSWGPVTVIVDPRTYILTTAALPSEGGSVSGAGTYNSGTVVPVTASPNLGWTFTGWSGDLSGTNNPSNVTMDGNKSVTANFEEDADVTINYVASTGGSVDNASETLAPATGVAVGSTAAADSGYHFVNWTDSGSAEVSTNLYFVPAKVGGLNVAATYTANFEENAGCLLVKVFNPTGEGFGAGTVTLFNSSMTFGPYDTLANGWYTFTNIPVGTYTLKADRPGVASWVRPSIEVIIVIGTECQEISLHYE